MSARSRYERHGWSQHPKREIAPGNCPWGSSWMLLWAGIRTRCSPRYPAIESPTTSYYRERCGLPTCFGRWAWVMVTGYACSCPIALSTCIAGSVFRCWEPSAFPSTLPINGMRRRSSSTTPVPRCWWPTIHCCRRPKRPQPWPPACGISLWWTGHPSSSSPTKVERNTFGEDNPATPPVNENAPTPSFTKGGQGRILQGWTSFSSSLKESQSPAPRPKAISRRHFHAGLHLRHHGQSQGCDSNPPDVRGGRTGFRPLDPGNPRRPLLHLFALLSCQHPVLLDHGSFGCGRYLGGGGQVQRLPVLGPGTGGHGPP